MRAWSGCRVRLLDAEGREVFRDDDCDVRVAGEQIQISYFDDEGPVVFVGLEDGDGFDLVCRSRPRKARMRFNADDSRLEGHWSQDDEAGGWTIELD